MQIFWLTFVVIMYSTVVLNRLNRIVSRLEELKHTEELPDHPSQAKA